LLYSVFCAWLGLLSLTQLAPESGWHSLWLGGIISTSSVGLYSMSNRYANPFMIRSKDSTQTPLIAIAARQTERVRRRAPPYTHLPPRPPRPSQARPGPLTLGPRTRRQAIDGVFAYHGRLEAGASLATSQCLLDLPAIGRRV